MNYPIKIAIIQFPGTNTERETLMAIERVGMKAVEFLWNDDFEKLKKYDGYIIAGGFSYEDRSRAGIIASLDPIVQEIREQSKSGKPVLGICNGAQILVESGLVPGLKKQKLGMALTDNKRTKDGHVLGTGYYNNWTNLVLSVPSKRTAFTRNLKEGCFINVPFAHAEGRFIIPDELLNELIVNNQTVFRYGDYEGNINSEFPTNPNGSVNNLAAVCNSQGNVMAIMPHPERTSKGDCIFTSMREYILDSNSIEFPSLKFFPNKYDILKYRKPDNSIEWFVDSIITDNEAVSVQNTFDHLNIPVSVSKLKYWSIELSDDQPMDSEYKIDKSGELYNSNKERLIKFDHQTNTKYLLVCPKEDLIGRKKTEMLKNHFDIVNLKVISSGVVWKVTIQSSVAQEAIKEAINTNIFFNPFSHDCYEI